MLETIITSKTRLKLLIKFFVNIANSGYLNSLANEFGESTNAVRKELNNLSKAGYLNRKEITNKVVYSANQNHPLFFTLQSIVRTHLGIEEIIEKILLQIGSINKIILLGDYAKGVDSGLIEILIIGNNINVKFLEQISPKIENKIKRRIKFSVSSREEVVDGLVVFSS